MFSRLNVEVDGRKVLAAALAQGLDLLTGQRFGAVIVVGHTGFYPHFGFSHELARHLVSPFRNLDAFTAL
jgi:predicted N-acetyltransferase YhbS